jgi:hypothetical protein
VQEEEATTTLLHLMTPDYASPEQVESPGTSSDIYSLGVLLYELLTRRRPYRLAGKRLDEVLATVCEKEIEKPRAGAADLDAIILKALQKEPQRRYRSVERLAADVQCYLEGRPVSAPGHVLLPGAEIRRAVGDSAGGGMRGPRGGVGRSPCRFAMSAASLMPFFLAGVPSLLAFREEPIDRDAKLFAEFFYSALAKSVSLERATYAA